MLPMAVKNHGRPPYPSSRPRSLCSRMEITLTHYLVDMPSPLHDGVSYRSHRTHPKGLHMPHGHCDFWTAMLPRKEEADCSY